MAAPAAAVSLGGILAVTRRRSRRDPERAHALMWGLWLLALGASFSVSSSINSYYVAALDPAVAALVAAGAALAWRERRSVVTRLVVIVTVVATAGYSLSLLPGSGRDFRAGWNPHRSCWPSGRWPRRPRRAPVGTG